MSLRIEPRADRKGPARRTRTARLKNVALLFGTIACHRADGPTSDAASDTLPVESPAISSSLSVSLPAKPMALLSPRCRTTQVGFSLDKGASRDELEIGDAIAYAHGYAVSFVHRTSAGRVGAVALLHFDDHSVRVVDLGPTLGDAPPPRIARRSNDLIAAQFGAPGSGERLRDAPRELVLHVIDPATGQRPSGSIPQQRDDSLAFDVALSGGDGLVVWDEATAGGGGNAGRGVIRAVSLQGDQRAQPHDLSPPESDAEAPRVLSNAGGFLVIWLARRPESTTAPETSADPEATGEPRAYAWLEMIALDLRGNATGPVRRLTSTTGHVSAFDVQALPGAAKATALVVARDDGEAVDGSGGVLLRIPAREESVEPTTAFPSDGLGRGVPMLVAGPAPWLGWVGPHEQLRLLPLDAAGAPVAPPSAEDALDDARPLVLLSPEESKALADSDADGSDLGWAARMLVATPDDPAAALRVFACRH